MNTSIKVVIALVVVFMAIQFIQPARNQSGQALPSDIANTYILPENVQAIFKSACYDCHSNNTNYPWYFNVQPLGWFLANHVQEGKAELNFSDFGSYSARRQMSKLRAIENSIQDETMPLTSYTLIHKEARLTNDEKATILNWVNKQKDSLSLKRQ